MRNFKSQLPDPEATAEAELSPEDPSCPRLTDATTFRIRFSRAFSGCSDLLFPQGMRKRSILAG